MGRPRLLEALAYISTELHKSFKPIFTGGGSEQKAVARKAVATRLQLLADGLQGDYLFGDRPSVADCYLFVMPLWSDKFDIVVPEPLSALCDRVMARPSVQTAMKHEGLI